MSKERFDIHQHITDKIVSAIVRGAATSACPGAAPPAASFGLSTSHRRSRIAASMSWRFGPPPLQVKLAGTRPRVCLADNRLHRHRHVWTALSCLDVRPLIKGYFSALRGSWVRSCLRPSFAENRIRWP
jgi:hypothetical protein